MVAIMFPIVYISCYKQKVMLSLHKPNTMYSVMLSSKTNKNLNLSFNVNKLRMYLSAVEYGLSFLIKRNGLP